MKKLFSLFISCALVSAPALALAESADAVTGVSANPKPTLETAGQNAKARADQEIQRRITSIGQLMARLGTLKHLSDSQKSELQKTLSSQVETLSALKTKIAADTDSATLKADIQSITKNYRVYALVLPQARVIASADRVTTIADKIRALGAKIEPRIAASADSVALRSTYTDMQARLTSATTKANAAASAVAGLVPDKGDSVVSSANTSALKAARAQVEVATTELKDARADLKTLLAGLGLSGNQEVETRAGARVE